MPVVWLLVLVVLVVVAVVLVVILVVLLLVLGVLVAVVLVVVVVVVPPLNQYLVLPRGRFGVFINVNPFTNAGLGSLCGVPHVGVQGHHFCKETLFKSRTFRACVFWRSEVCWGAFEGSFYVVTLPGALHTCCMCLCAINFCALPAESCWTGLLPDTTNNLFGSPPRFGELY